MEGQLVLVGYDGSAPSRDALALAEAIAHPTKSKVLLGWVESVGPMDLPYEAILEPVQGRAQDALSAVADEVRSRGAEVTTRIGLFGSAAHGLQELAETEGADLIVVGSSHRGRVGHVLAGTVSVRLLHGAPCPVAIAPRGFAVAERKLARIAVGFDCSPEAMLALSWAENLAAALGTELHLVVVSDDRPEDVPRVARAKRHEAARVLANGIDRVTLVRADGSVRHGWPGAQLADHSAHTDLIVAGSRGYGPLRRVLLGSVSTYLAEHSRCPVVITPRAAVERRRATSPAGAVSAP